jgi:hypothetical protein
MAAVLAIATVVAAGLTVLPSFVQDAQANPCVGTTSEGSSGDTNGGNAAGGDPGEQDANIECKFIGNLEDAFDED